MADVLIFNPRTEEINSRELSPRELAERAQISQRTAAREVEAINKQSRRDLDLKSLKTANLEDLRVIVARLLGGDDETI